MTNLQLLLSIGIPSLLIVFSWVNGNLRADRLDKRMDKFDERLDQLRDAGHRDALEIMRSMTALHERVAVVESKQGI